MQKWVVGFDDLKTIDTLEQMEILSYKPLFHEKCKFVFVETDMSKEEILRIEGVKSCRKERIGTLWI